MSILTAVLAFVPASILLLMGLVPTSFANRRVGQFRRSVVWLSGVQFLAAVVAFAMHLPAMLTTSGSPVWKWPSLVTSAILYYDGLAGLMLVLVSFVGLAVCHYSLRYLDGDENQGRFYRWVGMTIGAVSLVVMSGNLLMLYVAWVLTSLGLHHLLLHYPGRRGARRAAWTKFTISRVGDAMLVVAIALVYREFGTLNLSDVLAAVEGSGGDSAGIQVIAWLFMLGAVTKSAQFPLHTWLPETMETPTPVSALMHAGIVNAGGYLVIRLSPILVEAPAALAVLAIIGTVTVAYAGVVMLTQTSVKRSLAYSTIAQMGFMMLQCGLGAFSAAMLHILAHSLYKAYAFLNSGSVLVESSGMCSAKPDSSDEPAKSSLPAALAVSSISVIYASLLFGISVEEKSGGIVLGVVLILALASWLWDVLRLNVVRTTLTGFLITPLLALSYMAGYFLVDRVVAANVSKLLGGGYLHAFSVAVVFTVFCGLIAIHFLLSTKRGKELLQPMQVHATNGFYLDVITQRFLARLRV